MESEHDGVVDGDAGERTWYGMEQWQQETRNRIARGLRFDSR